MAKSPLAKNSKTGRYVKNSKNVTHLHLTIPYKHTDSRGIREFDISHLLHLGTNKKNKKIKSREPYLRAFCNKAKQYVDNAKSAESIRSYYEVLQPYIIFCDAIQVDPFSQKGYLKYVGNDGELRHRIRVYQPSKKLWERTHGDELGIKESTANDRVSILRKVLAWCGLTTDSWANHHRSFSSYCTPSRGYSDAEEKILVTRLSELFFTLAPQLIAAKKEKLKLPKELPVTLDLSGHQEVIFLQVSIETKHYLMRKSDASVKYSAAFNMVMGAAYHLMCFFTSLNDGNVKSITHPIKVHTDERDKSLQVVKVSSFKSRANKEVDAVLTNQSFDVDKRDGVKFIKTLETLSKLYSEDKEYAELLFTLNSEGKKSDRFNLKEINKHLMVNLSLLSPTRKACIPWFKELFYGYRNRQAIKLGKTRNELGRLIVNKFTIPCSEGASTRGATNAAFCILSCYTNAPLKGVLLPLSYSDKDLDGNIYVSLKYRDGSSHKFSIPASDKTLIQDIEKYATELADKQRSRNYERLLIKRGSTRKAPDDWKGVNPISANLMTAWSIEPNEYYISLQSSRWREMTSNQVYTDNSHNGVQSLLQNTYRTIDKHYSNGDPRLNKVIISQAMQVMEQLDNNTSLEQAKTIVQGQLGIAILSHDQWKKKQEVERAKTNPNGIYCNGEQNIVNDKNTQRVTNTAIGLALHCTEYDMCYKCQSAQAVDDVESVYKLVSFIDVLKDAINKYPNAKNDVHEKITAFEFTLDGVSKEVYELAVELFNKNGRHPRVSIDHATLAIYRQSGTKHDKTPQILP